ncbi:MAG: hypothetical protein GPJ51_02335 [Candidatus Heimdallarchaeota archaeon]|nr:hypothetical protein [Candidatus Heimdallarchaeota archaeon]
MELNNIKTYLAIGIVGLTVGVLYMAIQKDLPKTLTIFFITLYVVVALRFFLERRHYKKHKTILASTQFLILPFCIMLMGNYISPIAAAYEIFSIDIDLSGGSSIYSPFNLISISLIFPVIVLSLYFRNFYSGKWPAIAVNRKVRRGRKIPFLINTTYVAILLVGFFINWQIDFVGFIFVILYFIFIFRYFIIAFAMRSDQQAQVTSSRSASTTRRSKRSVSTRSRRPTASASSASKASRSSSAKIAPGIDVKATRSTTTKKTSKITTVSKKIFPIGTPKKEEMQCIICYMDFDKKDRRRIILCPHCRYPAHEDEFMSWFKTSRLCARCNQTISTRYVNNPKYRINIKLYIEKVIEKL